MANQVSSAEYYTHLTLILACLGSVAISSAGMFKGVYWGLTLQEPFSDWLTLKDLVRLTKDKTPASVNLTQRVLEAAWCYKLSARGFTEPYQRSDGCACLYNTMKPLNASNRTFTQSDCDLYVDRVLSCLRNRATWSTWRCGDTCRIYPTGVAFTMACLVLIFALLYFCKEVLGWGRGASIGVSMTVGLAAVCMLCVVSFVGNIVPVLFVLISMACAWKCMEGERSGMAFVWWPIPYVAALTFALGGAGNLVRDVVGVFCYGLGGYFYGTFGQRLLWSKRHAPGPFQTWLVHALSVASLVVLLFMTVIAYTEYNSRGFGAMPGVALGSASLIVFVVLLELWWNDERDVVFSSREVVQASLLGASLLLTSVSSTVDAWRQ